MANAPLIEIRNLKKHFPIAGIVGKRRMAVVRAVDDVSLDIMPGETLGLVGESGCGKTTVGRLVLRLIEPTAGSVKFAGQPLFELGREDVRKLRSEMQLVFQDPYGSLNPRMTIQDILLEPLEVHGYAPVERQERVKWLLSVVGLEPSYRTRYPHQLSGGQHQRVAIARALALNPKFIVCDEAVSALDVSIQSQVLNLLEELQAQFSLTFLFIAHNLSVVKHISHRIAVMYLGRLFELAPGDDLYQNPLHPYTQALLSAVPIPEPGARTERIVLPGEVPNAVNPPSGCLFHPRCRLAGDECRETAPLWHEVANGHWVACHRSA